MKVEVCGDLEEAKRYYLNESITFGMNHIKNALKNMSFIHIFFN